MKVEEIEVGKTDNTGTKIIRIYAKRVPNYAVYQTPERAAIQYANDEEFAATQRKWMAPLNILRAQIDALVDGWRKGSKAKASGYDARVAAALILCLEQDVAGAQTSLTDIKNDILAERNSWGRLQYLLSASLVAIAIAAVLALAWASSVDFKCGGLQNIAKNHPLLLPFGTSLGYGAFGAVLGFVGGSLGFAIAFAPANPQPWTWVQRRGLIIASIVTCFVVLLLGPGAWVVASCPSASEISKSALNLGTSIWIGGVGGVGGAFFSIALGTMQRTVATSLNPRDNFADAALRVIVGLIGAWVLVLMLRAQLVPDFTIAGKSVTGQNATVEITLLVGFIAGFLERLVPDLLEKKEGDKTKEAEEKTKQSEEKLKQLEEKLMQVGGGAAGSAATDAASAGADATNPGTTAIGVATGNSGATPPAGPATDPTSGDPTAGNVAADDVATPKKSQAV
jgi:hypothetical protein